MTDAQADKDGTTAEGSAFDWDHAAHLVGATDFQKRFAIARAKGATRKAAAKEAGYKGNDEQLRKRGSEVDRAEAVRKLLGMAQINGAAVAGPPLDRKELKVLLSDATRKGDRQASAQLIRLEEIERQADAVDEFDGRGPERMAIEFSREPGGAIGYAVLWQAEMGGLANMPMLHLIAATAARSHPEVWAALRERCTYRGRLELDRQLLDDDWGRQFYRDLNVPLVPRADRLLAAGQEHADGHSVNGAEVEEHSVDEDADGSAMPDSEKLAAREYESTEQP